MKHLSLPRKILLVLAILLVLYLIPCFYVSAELNRIVHDSYRTFGKQITTPKSSPTSGSHV